MKSMRYGDYTYLEIKDLITEGCMAIVPTGCTEQQGPHLPVDNDTWFVETVAFNAAKLAMEQYGVRSLVLPAFPFGPTPEHRNFGFGYVNIPHSIHEDLVGHVLVSLAEQGFNRIVVWRGCGEHRLQSAVNSFNETHLGEANAFLPDLPYHDIWCRIGDPKVSGGHADSFTTSLSLVLRSGSVRTGEIPSGCSKSPDWNDPNLDFSDFSDTGVIGDASHTSEQLGLNLWEEIKKVVAGVFRDIAEMPLR